VKFAEFTEIQHSSSVNSPWQIYICITCKLSFTLQQKHICYLNSK